MRYTCLPLDTPTEPTRTLPWTPRLYSWRVASSHLTRVDTRTGSLLPALGVTTAVSTLLIHDATDSGDASPLAMADFCSSPLASSPRNNSSTDTRAANSI